MLCLTCQSFLRASIRVTFQKDQTKIYITSTISVTWLNVDDSKRCQETVIGRLQGKGLKIRNADWVKFKGIEIVIWRTKSTFHLICISVLWASLFCNQIKMPWKYRLGRSSSAPITGRTGNKKLLELLFLVGFFKEEKGWKLLNSFSWLFCSHNEMKR